MQNLDNTSGSTPAGVETETTSERKRRDLLLLIASLGVIAVIAGVLVFTSRSGSDSAQIEKVESMQATDTPASPTTTATALVDTTTVDSAVVEDPAMTPGSSSGSAPVGTGTPAGGGTAGSAGGTPGG